MYQVVYKAAHFGEPDWDRMFVIFVWRLAMEREGELEPAALALLQYDRLPHALCTSCAFVVLFFFT